MNTIVRLCSYNALALATALWLTGCNPPTKDSPKAATDGHTDHDHADSHEHGHDDHAHPPGHEHDAKELTEADVKLPANFKAGVAHLKELSGKIEHLIEHNELCLGSAGSGRGGSWR